MNVTAPATLLVCLLAAACRGPEAGAWLLADGTPVRDLLPDQDTAVVLVADPGECFTCTTAVGEWAARRAAGEVPVYLILTREPTAAERKQLTAFRLPVSGVLARPLPGRQRVPSMEYLFVRRAPVMSDTLRTGRYSSTVVEWARVRSRSAREEIP